MLPFIRMPIPLILILSYYVCVPSYNDERWCLLLLFFVTSDCSSMNVSSKKQSQANDDPLWELLILTFCSKIWASDTTCSWTWASHRVSFLTRFFPRYINKWSVVECVRVQMYASFFPWKQNHGNQWFGGSSSSLTEKTQEFLLQIV